MPTSIFLYPKEKENNKMEVTDIKIQCHTHSNSVYVLPKIHDDFL